MESVANPLKRIPTPFHNGELCAQDRIGVRSQMEKVGAVLRDYMPQQHRDFFPLLPTFFIGGSDARGDMWASMLWGSAGFVQSPDPTTLRIDAHLQSGDPLAAVVEPGTPLGGLGLQFETRRRNRANGIVTSVDAQGLAVNVLQSFGNCAKYIQTRQQTIQNSVESALPAVSGERNLPDAALALIRRSDTFFIATSVANVPANAVYGADVSHRGGRPGFVGIDAEGALVWPDFQGNNFFNTIGNLLIDARAGLLFIDFEHGDLLHLSGRAEVVWEGEQVTSFAGAKRLLRFMPQRFVWRPRAFPQRWTFSEQSSHLDATGIWNV